MKHHLHFTELSQEQLDWLSRFADRLRLELEHFAEERQGEHAADIAASLSERPEWRAMAPEAAAERWLAERSPKA